MRVESPSLERTSPAQPFSNAEIGYILKGYARTSETFITNEIHLLEQAGLELTIFSLKKLEGEKRHAVVDSIRAPVNYLPPASAGEKELFRAWFSRNLSLFSASHRRLFAVGPVNYLRTLAEALRFGFKYRDANGQRLWRSFLKEFWQAGYIAQRVLESGQVRHLHAHFCHTTTTVTMLASRLSGIPFSFTAHAKDIYLKELNPGDLLQTKMRRAEFVVTCTKANEVYLKRLCPEGAPVHTIYHGLDTSQFAPAAALGGAGGPPQSPLILSVGRFVEKKGFTYLVEACRLLKQQGYEFQCHIVGGGDAYLRTVENLIKELKLDGTVRTLPAVTQEELIEIYRRATLFVLPCQVVENGDRDGIPNVLVEAMATELPAVSTNVSGIPELIEDRVDGLMVPQRDAAALAQAIAELLDDAGLRQRLGKAARRKVCRLFDAQANVLALRGLFLTHLPAGLKPAAARVRK